MRRTSFHEIALRMDSAENFTMFFVGDSITEGAGASSADHTYVAAFAQKLTERYPNHNVIRYDGQLYPIDPREAELKPLKTYGEPIHIQDGTMGTLTVVRSGVGGNTVRRMLNRKDDFICREVGGRTADLLLINVGVNDAIISNKDKYVPSAVYGENLIELLDQIEADMPDTDIVLMTPTYNDLGDSLDSCLDDYSAMMKQIAMEKNIPVIDLHSQWMEHLVVGAENYGQGDWLTGRRGDSTHPSDVGAKAMADVIYQTLLYTV